MSLMGSVQSTGHCLRTPGLDGQYINQSIKVMREHSYWLPAHGYRTKYISDVNLKSNNLYKLPKTMEVQNNASFQPSRDERNCFLWKSFPMKTNLPSTYNYSTLHFCKLKTLMYLVDRTNLASRVRFSSLENCMTPGVSNFCLIHWHCSRSLINMNSTPMCWQ